MWLLLAQFGSFHTASLGTCPSYSSQFWHLQLSGLNCSFISILPASEMTITKAIYLTLAMVSNTWSTWYFFEIGWKIPLTHNFYILYIYESIIIGMLKSKTSKVLESILEPRQRLWMPVWQRIMRWILEKNLPRHPCRRKISYNSLSRNIFCLLFHTLEPVISGV